MVAGVCYVKGDNVDNGRGFEGKQFDCVLDVGYVVERGSLKGLSVRSGMSLRVPTTRLTSMRTA
uniref:Outer membrane porin, OprD family n=1 Tax=Pseudomonas putida TaxID=303 RepID=A0A6C0L645_PSEPU|nr:outer membrane porin, OprD family [Pseudomonas putida]